MNAGKHTPGPWTASGTQVCTWTKENYTTNVPFTYDPPLPAPSRQWTEKLVSEAKANAHLIAAAPDMLEALESALLELKRLDDDGSAYDRMKIRNAIAKAKGEA